MSLTKKNMKNLIKECMTELREAYGGPNTFGNQSGANRGGQSYLAPEEESKGRWRQFGGELDTQEGRDFCERICDVFRSNSDMLISFLELAEDHPDHQDKFFTAMKKMENIA